MSHSDVPPFLYSHQGVDVNSLDGHDISHDVPILRGKERDFDEEGPISLYHSIRHVAKALLVGRLEPRNSRLL